MVLDGFANIDATLSHNFIAGDVQDEQILLVLQYSRNNDSSFLANLTVGDSEVGHSLVISDTVSQKFSSLLANAVVIEDQLCHKPLVLEALGEVGDGSLGEPTVSHGEVAKRLDLSQTVGNRFKAFIADRIAINVKFTQLELVREHFT